jgi:hypothetical protein
VQDYRLAQTGWACDLKLRLGQTRFLAEEDFRMKFRRLVLTSIGLALAASPSIAGARGPEPSERPMSFEAKLNQRVGRYSSAGRSLTDSVVEIAFKYQLPLGIEFVDRDAVRKPLNLEIHDKSVRELLNALVAAIPEFRIDLSGGIIQLYAPRVREDNKSILNTAIENFEVTDMDPYMADWELICALNRQVLGAGCQGSHPSGSPQRVSLHLQKAKVYEILNAIVAKQGAVWFVAVRPETLSTIQADMWHVFELTPPFDTVVKERLRNIVPPAR